MQEMWKKHLGLAVPEAAAFATSEAKEAASPVSLPAPDLQSLGSPAMHMAWSGEEESLHNRSLCTQKQPQGSSLLGSMLTVSVLHLWVCL